MQGGLRLFARPRFEMSEALDAEGSKSSTYPKITLTPRYLYYIGY